MEWSLGMDFTVEWSLGMKSMKLQLRLNIKGSHMTTALILALY